MDKLNIAFILSTNLAMGRGCEVTALKYINNFDTDRFNVILVHTDNIKLRRINDQEIKNQTRNVDLVLLKTYEWLHRVVTKRRVISYPAYLMKFHLIKLLVRRKNKKEIEKIESCDILYFFTNEYSTFFKKGKKIFIGSNHTNFPATNNLQSLIEHRLVNAGIIFRKLDYLHLFPGLEESIGKFSNKDVFTVQNGVDSKSYLPAKGKIDSDVKFLFVAHLSKSKGIITLLNAWNSISSHKGMQLHVAGGGELSDLVKKTKDVVYHGLVTEDHLRKIYSEADIFVYPTEADNFPLVVAQAFSSGLYVITSNKLRGRFVEFDKKGHIKYLDVNSDLFKSEMLASAREIRQIRKDAQKVHEISANVLDWNKIGNDLFSKMEEIYIERREL